MMKPTTNPSTPKNSYRLRIFLLMAGILIFILFIGWRLFDLQILSHNHYVALADNQHSSQSGLDPKRGEIYLTPDAPNSQPMLVATNVDASLVRVNQKLIQNPTATAAALAPVLQMNRGD